MCSQINKFMKKTKKCFVSALYVAEQKRPAYRPLLFMFYQIQPSGSRWQCTAIVEKKLWVGSGVSKRQAKQAAAEKTCAALRLSPVLYGESYNLPPITTS